MSTTIDTRNFGDFVKTAGDSLEVFDAASLCRTGREFPDGLLFGCDSDGDIDGCFNAEDEDIIGCLDSPDWIPAGAWEFVDNALMTGAFAKIVRREA